LQALVKWGEHQLSLKPDATKEASEAAAAANTATLGRKAPKRREVCDSELKELLAPLLPYVRIPHVLPRDKTSEVLDMALQRNLFSVLPNFTSQVNAATKYSPWDPKSTNGLFVRPRLFLPYFDECKKLIQDRCAQDPEIISSNSPCVSVPDTLYMLRSAGRNKVDSMNAEGLLQFQSSKLPGIKKDACF
jgi:BTB/POZ domain-containing protein 7